MAVVLSGYRYKAEQLAAAKALADEAAQAAKEAKDAEYAARQAVEQAELLQEVAAGGPAACQARLDAEAARLDALRQIAQPSRPERAELRKLEAEAALFGPLAAGDADDCRQAIDDAMDAARHASQEAVDANAFATSQRLNAEAERARAGAIADLNAKGWTQDHTLPDRSVRAQEGELLKMQAELQALGANQPPGATQYCAALEQSVDHRAHRVPCARCSAAAGLNGLPPVEHALDRTPAAKTALTTLLDELDRLAAVADPATLSEQETRDRLIGLELKRLRENAGAAETPGKMMGVLLCRAGDGTIVTLRAFSGDIHGDDDVAGWATHIPPDGPGSYLVSAGGGQRPLGALPAPQGTPHGVCAAPKMIQQAYRDGLVPVALAEAWYGRDDKGKTHRGLVASCSTCMKNLDVQLCPLIV